MLGIFVYRRDVADDFPVLQKGDAGADFYRMGQGDAGADFYRMGQVMARHEDGGTRFLVVGLKQVPQCGLRTGVEEIERFVQNQELGAVKQGGKDARFLLVARREVPDEFLLP